MARALLVCNYKNDICVAFDCFGLPLGFINPAIYSDSFSPAFNDITSGGNQGCGMCYRTYYNLNSFTTYPFGLPIDPPIHPICKNVTKLL